MKTLPKIKKFGIIQENLSKLYKAIRLNNKILQILKKPGWNQDTFTCKSEYYFEFITEDDKEEIIQQLQAGVPQYVPQLTFYTPQFLKLSKPYRQEFIMPNMLRNSYYVNTTPNGVTIYKNELELIANYNYIISTIKDIINHRKKFTTIEMKYMNRVYNNIRLL